MFLVKPELSATEKNTDEHPWTHRIKDKYSNKIKYAHNSIRNPRYPKEKEKESPKSKRIKLTIIGDRVTKEFIYCSKLVKGLYKYRKMVFEAPVVQGVTTVEWPVVCNDLKVRYGGLAYCLTSSVAVLINTTFLGGQNELKELVKSKFSYHLSPDYYKESISEFAQFVSGSGLYSDILPYTCANFLRLCKETKGGYSGTPIHRIVKDGWIQGGGFALKETDLDCENFTIPHDRRGVLGMANSGLHMECSTQFFVLLQPAPWMADKFVAFGQLIEGKKTLEKIEAVPTWYESPTSEIIIFKAGVCNLDCHNIMINKGANEYLDRHIEDLNELGELFYEELLERVFLTAQLRELERLKKEQEGEGGGEDDGATGVRETRRFNRRKEDIEKQLQTNKDVLSRPSTAVSRATGSVAPHPTSDAANENNDFDVETYDPEYEDADYQHQSFHTPSLVVKPKKPFYIPLTDVPYPDEKDSDFDLKRFLQGDYCLESDLLVPANTFIPHEMDLFLSELSDESDEEIAGDSAEEREIRRYLKSNVDRVSFAGGVVRNIGKTAKMDYLEDLQKSELITDNQLRRMRLAAIDRLKRDLYEKKVSISMPSEKSTHTQIKRRQTGFVRPADLAKICKLDNLEDEDEGDDDDKHADDIESGSRKVRIAASTEDTKHRVRRRVTSYHPKHIDDDDDNDDDEDDDDNDDVNKVHYDDEDDGPDIRQSVLVRLFDEVKGSEEPPTLKDYKPMSEYHPHPTLLTFSSNYRIKSESEGNREQLRYFRHSLTVDDDSFEQVLNIQYGKKVARKISTDYAKTIDQIERRLENSLRSVEFAKKRPTLSISEYQMRNRMYQEQQKST